MAQKKFKSNIINFFNKETNINKKNLESLKYNLDINVNTDNLQTFTNIIYDIVNIIPYIIINKSFNSESLPEYLKKILSTKHVADIHNILSSYYLEFLNFEHVEEMKIINNIIKNKITILLKILYLFKFKNDINFTYNNNERFTTAPVSAIKNLLEKNNLRIVKEIIFPDHYQYNEKDIIKIQNLAHQNNAKIITTEKDFVKISDEEKIKINYLEIELIIIEEQKFVKFLNDKINK